MILAGRLLLDDGAGRCRVAAGYVRLEGDVICEVVEGVVPSHADAGSARSLISPGFIDAHLHLPQFDTIGAHGLPLLRWLDEVTYPAEARWSDVDHARDMTARVVAQLLSVGTTGICAFATVHHQSAIAALEIARDAGMRGVIGQVLMNRQAPSDLCRSTSQLLDEAARLGDLFPPAGRMAAAVTPRFAVSCTPSLLAGAGQLAKERVCMVQSHLAETRNECQLVSELFTGQRYVDVYAAAGLLGSRSNFGHGVYLDRDDRQQLGDAGSVIAHCPTANSFLRSGTMDRDCLIDAGVTVVLGSDIGAGYERSMVRVARAMIEAAAGLGESHPDAAAAWHLITRGNADALGWKDAGRLEVGATADLLVIEPTIDWLGGDVDPLSMLMFAWDDRWLRRTIVRGRPVFPC